MIMNPYKLRAIVELVRRQGALPRDQFGEVLCVEDLLVWFGLEGRLHREERVCVARELAMVRDAEVFMESLQLKAL